MILTRTEKRRILRKELWGVMHDGRGRAGHAFHFTLVILILLSVAILPLEFFPGTEQLAPVFAVVDSVFVGLFTLEYALRIYAAPVRWTYVFSAAGIIDLLSVIPFYVGFAQFEYLRLLRLVRLLKILSIREHYSGEHGISYRNIDLVDGESIEYVVRRHPLFLLLSSIAPLVSLSFGMSVLLVAEPQTISIALSVGLILFSLMLLWKGWIDFAYDVIYLTNFRLIFQDRHLLGRSINHVDYRQITNVKPFYPNVLSFLFRYGSIVIDTAAETPSQIKLDTVRRHEKAAHLIMQKSLRAN